MILAHHQQTEYAPEYCSQHRAIFPQGVSRILPVAQSVAEIPTPHTDEFGTKVSAITPIDRGACPWIQCVYVPNFPVIVRMVNLLCLRQSSRNDHAVRKLGTQHERLDRWIGAACSFDWLCLRAGRSSEWLGRMVSQSIQPRCRHGCTVRHPVCALAD